MAMFRSHANFRHLGKLLVCYDNVAQLQLLIPPSTLATSFEELTHWKRLWCWEWLGAGVKGDDRGWDGWMASPTRWTWVWMNSGSWWWTGRPGVLQFMGSQRVGLNWTAWKDIFINSTKVLFSTSKENFRWYTEKKVHHSWSQRPPLKSRFFR